jgi:hypothetical protein
MAPFLLSEQHRSTWKSISVAASSEPMKYAGLSRVVQEAALLRELILARRDQMATK